MGEVDFDEALEDLIFKYNKAGLSMTDIISDIEQKLRDLTSGDY